MRKQRGFLYLVLLCIMTILASCGSQGGGSSATSEPTRQPEQEQKPQAVKVFDKGTIIRKEGNRLLVTAYAAKNGAPSIDAFWLTVNEQTVLQHASGQSVTSEKLTVGTQVEAWHVGTVDTSYPAQSGAAKIIVQDDAQRVPEGMIGQSEAIKAALQDLTGQTAARALKNVSLQAEDGFWKIELVQYEAIDQPQILRVDARTGKMIPVPVAENDAFRVYSPVPGTKVNATFTVEGEARVFEAAFSWTLEDGHNILAEGHQMAEEGAPAWGRFRFDVSYKNASQANIMLILYVHSAKDGKAEKQLVIPLKVPEEQIKYITE
ncbi:Gmad2 immunoglobulin-like domain-containing protein [Paenibacillus contaminans]|nr:Gmad2 immunoglobulin-like domain-containing protein [Paenibacillus contaminans]